MKRPCFLMALFFVVLSISAAGAQDAGYYNYEAPQGGQDLVQPEQRSVVTSVQKCYEAIGQEAATAIRLNSLTPYADCQKKRARMEKERAAQADADAAKAEHAETPENYVRVQLEKAAEPTQPSKKKTAP